MPGGDGVIHSPSSVFTSAMTPAKGERSSVRALSASISRVCACAWSRCGRGGTTGGARPVALASRRARRPVRSRSGSPAARRRRRQLLLGEVRRPGSSRRREPAPRGRSRARGRAAPAASASSRRSSSAPAATRAPARYGSATTRPPVSGDSRARRRALTVPARVLVTVSSTVPRVTGATRTGSGEGASSVKRRAMAPPATTSRTRRAAQPASTAASGFGRGARRGTIGACVAIRRVALEAGDDAGDQRQGTALLSDAGEGPRRSRSPRPGAVASAP